MNPVIVMGQDKLYDLNLFWGENKWGTCKQRLREDVVQKSETKEPQKK